MTKTIAIAVLALPVGGHGLDLDEYGVTLTGTGLIDRFTGLAWLDSALTDGGLDDLQRWLDAGWRIGSEAEIYFLLTREVSEFGGTAFVPLSVDDLGVVADRLTFEMSGPGGFGGAWVCRDYGDPQHSCTSTNAFGGQFSLELQAQAPDITRLSMFVYLSEVPMYGSIDCGKIKCDFLGRSLMVRPTGDDLDGDAVPDGIDNCTETPNPTQLDTDADLYGNACDFDADQDCVVGFGDLNLLKLAFFAVEGDAAYDIDLDFDLDGEIGFGDLNALKTRFFSSPGPSALAGGC